jgi:hypothetical protein
VSDDAFSRVRGGEGRGGVGLMVGGVRRMCGGWNGCCAGVRRAAGIEEGDFGVDVGVGVGWRGVVLWPRREAGSETRRDASLTRRSKKKKWSKGKVKDKANNAVVLDKPT